MAEINLGHLKNLVGKIISDFSLRGFYKVGNVVNYY